MTPRQQATRSYSNSSKLLLSKDGPALVRSQWKVLSQFCVRVMNIVKFREIRIIIIYLWRVPCRYQRRSIYCAFVVKLTQERKPFAFR